MLHGRSVDLEAPDHDGRLTEWAYALSHNGGVTAEESAYFSDYPMPHRGKDYGQLRVVVDNQPKAPAPKVTPRWPVETMTKARERRKMTELEIANWGIAASDMLWSKGKAGHMMGFSVMNDEADEGDDLSYEVSDEALEAAAGSNAMAQTITVFYLCAPPTSGQWCPV